ncbi:MAG: hypothetical protein KC636_26895 [Myxococcales bacterium]|nr:hypothetical protein [Myxococcales bacterium]
MFALTDDPEDRARFDITVYQLGWRLGGKARSGRNEGAFGRSESRGLPVWLGCYDNAFALVRRCYHELNRTPGTPLAHWRELFCPIEKVQLHSGEGEPREPVTLPTDDAVPGDGREQPSIWGYTRMLLRWILTAIPRLHADYRSHAELAKQWRQAPRLALRRALRAASHRGVGPYKIGGRGSGRSFDETLLEAVRADEDAKPPPRDPAKLRLWSTPLLLCAEHGLEVIAGDPKRLRDPWLVPLLRLATVVVRGLLEERLFSAEDGFASIDDVELREWLARHGADARLLKSALLTAFYDLFFAYEDGDRERPRIAAGTALRVALRGFLGWRGALLYSMQAAPGEAVFAPLYQVLSRRGVRFKFFHKVKELRADHDEPRVTEIRLGKQVALHNELRGYDPLISVKGAPCWPSAPRYEQIVLGDDPAIRAIDFESATGPEVDEVVLRAGVDYDAVILGVSLGALPRIARPLIDREPRWRAMVEGLETTATQGVSFWLTPGWDELVGQRSATPTTAGLGFPDPLGRWSSATPLVAKEAWPHGAWPRTCIQMAGVLPASFLAALPADVLLQRGQRLADERIHSRAITWIHLHGERLCPGLGSRDGAPWSALHDVDKIGRDRGRTGEARFDAQHWWANIFGSDRYVQSLPGSHRHRLRANDSGFANLILAGDWIDAGLNVGCIETAVVAGLQAARAIIGRPESILGERDTRHDTGAHKPFTPVPEKQTPKPAPLRRRPSSYPRIS